MSIKFDALGGARCMATSSGHGNVPLSKVQEVVQGLSDFHLGNVLGAL